MEFILKTKKCISVQNNNKCLNKRKKDNLEITRKFRTYSSNLMFTCIIVKIILYSFQVNYIFNYKYIFFLKVIVDSHLDSDFNLLSRHAYFKKFICYIYGPPVDQDLARRLIDHFYGSDSASKSKIGTGQSKPPLFNTSNRTPNARTVLDTSAKFYVHILLTSNGPPLSAVAGDLIGKSTSNGVMDAAPCLDKSKSD